MGLYADQTMPEKPAPPNDIRYELLEEVTRLAVNNLRRAGYSVELDPDTNRHTISRRPSLRRRLHWALHHRRD